MLRRPAVLEPPGGLALLGDSRDATKPKMPNLLIIPCVRRLPWAVWLAMVALATLGVAAIVRTDAWSAGTGRPWHQQCVWAVLGSIAAITSSFPSYRIVGRWAYGLFAAAVGLLVLVYFFPAVHGTHRWIRLAGLSVQPSEFAKVAFVLALARYLATRTLQQGLMALAMPITLALIPLVLVLREPDLGTSLVFLPVMFAMLFAAGARLRDLTALALVGLAMVPLVWGQMSSEQRWRVTSLFEQTVPGQRPTPDGYQLHQAKQLLAVGGTCGTWWSQDAVDDQAVYHLPEAHTDFIFVVIGERFGWPGMGTVLLLFAFIVWRALAIGSATNDPFGRMLTTGLAALLAVQVLVNTGMSIGLLPVTGLSLPLVSYGGSGMLAHALAVGLVLNVGVRPGYAIGPAPFGARSRLAA